MLSLHNIYTAAKLCSPSYKHFPAWSFFLRGLRRGARERRSCARACVSVQLCVRRGARADQGVEVEALQRLQWQSEAPSSFGSSVWSLSQLQDHLAEKKSRFGLPTKEVSVLQGGVRCLPPLAGAEGGRGQKMIRRRMSDVWNVPGSSGGAGDFYTKAGDKKVSWCFELVRLQHKNISKLMKYLCY